MAIGILMRIIKMALMISLLAEGWVMKPNVKMSSINPFTNTAEKMKKALKAITLSILLMANNRNKAVPPHNDILETCFAMVIV